MRGIFEYDGEVGVPLIWLISKQIDEETACVYSIASSMLY